MKSSEITLTRRRPASPFGQGVEHETRGDESRGTRQYLHEESEPVRCVGRRNQRQHDRDSRSNQADAVPQQAAGPASGNRNRGRLRRDLFSQSDRRRKHVQIWNEVDDQCRVHELEIRFFDRVTLGGSQDE